MDTIANFLTTIRNGYLARKPAVRVPVTKVNRALAHLLVAERYLAAEQTVTDGETNRHHLELTLRYTAGQPAIARIRRLSTPGRRLYSDSRHIPHVRTGIGTVVISTPHGLLTHRTARERQVGGELICEIIRGGSQ
ncbi:30S ribosomal protein S8 [Candidatus Berkelbacteria bacterium]|nr:30S ribosomal protein S8 [Candidatus Berkelbacteria bacterium]